MTLASVIAAAAAAAAAARGTLVSADRLLAPGRGRSLLYYGTALLFQVSARTNRCNRSPFLNP